MENSLEERHGAEAATAELCVWLADAYHAALPESVIREASRTLLNVVGTGIGASRSEGVEALVRHSGEHGGTGVVTIPGREEKLDPYLGAIAIGLASHYDDFDDTHLETVIHPGAACLGALLAVDGTERVSGRAALAAYALGCEAQLRVGVAMSPDHYDEGWHITATCGVLGAAVTAWPMLGFDAPRLEQAVGLAASQTLGVREAFGTMTKPLHPGKVAANGVFAARLVQSGFTGPDAVLERPGGYFATLTPRVDLTRLTRHLGTEWELLSNTYKPYPCGIVIHPAIDAAVALAPRIDDPARVTGITLRCHPLVAELTGNPDPLDGLQARFSAIHGVCAGLVDGTVGLAQYDDDRVRSDDLVLLRSRTVLEVDPDLPRDSAEVTVHLADGTRSSAHVPHARGSAALPLTDLELHAKVDALVRPVLGDQVTALTEAVEGLGEAASLDALHTAMTTNLLREGHRT